MNSSKANPTLKRLKLFTCIVAANAAAITSSPTIAQEELEEVVVTGSRIARDVNLTGALPVQTISGDELRLSGEFSLVDKLNDTPALFSSQTSEQTPGTAFRLGTNVLSLRGLGTRRTLTLVDGRRHVGGIQGSSAVDVGSVPEALVERVEVLTGGASAVYGADAVTGVVNFVLRDDFEGIKFDARTGMSGEGDSETVSLSAVYGFNFAENRGNMVVAIDFDEDQGLQVSDRSRSEFIGSARDWVNPDLRFQQGDINSSTPNLDRYYDYNATGLNKFGLPIPDAADFAADYAATFGSDPSLTAEEQALFNRAANAPQRAILPGRTFPFTSGYGYIIPGNPYTFAGFDPAVPIDLDGNGNPDCLDSFTGYNSVFGAESFGVVGGCWNITEDGTYRPVQDGLISGDFQGFGGDSFNTIQNRRGDVFPPEERIGINIMSHYDLTPEDTLFVEAKYYNQDTKTNNDPNSFWDLLPGFSDNPFLPDFIQSTADAYGAVATTVDPLFFNDIRQTERDTYRFVAGVEGFLDNGWTYEVSANYGRYDETTSRTASVINDRFFAALDAVIDPATGDPACRIEVDPSAPALNTPFQIPAYEEGYFSFTPGAGQCIPLNIWAGQPGISPEARAWVTTPTWDELRLEQTVISAMLTGDSEDFFSLPGGAIGFAAGVEWREETSTAKFDSYQLGIIPADAAYPEGTKLSDVSDNANLVFRPQLSNANEVGEYDVTDVFVELSLPILSGVPGVEELTVDLKGRFSDYSTIGNAETLGVNMIYAPIESLAFRGSYSQAVRAPNITELFGPEIGTTFRPVDPCDAAQINALAADDPTLAAQYQANCTADLQSFGLDPTQGSGTYSFSDPLSASFGGIAGGNPDLTEETADTMTAGFVFTPSAFLPGLSLTADYWEIEIEDAISSVTSQDIVDGCYRGASLNSAFCSLFTRNQDPNSAQYGGFNFLRSTDVNFAKLETSGVDFAVSYTFDIGEHNLDARVQGTIIDELNEFTNPADLTEVDPELEEIRRPELAGNVFLTWNWRDLSVNWQSQYVGEQLLRFANIETADTLYGESVFMDETWVHNINATYLLTDELTVYGGVRNLDDEQPFITDRSWPVSARGRFFYLGIDFEI